MNVRVLVQVSPYLTVLRGLSRHPFEDVHGRASRADSEVIGSPFMKMLSTKKRLYEGVQPQTHSFPLAQDD